MAAILGGAERELVKLAAEAGDARAYAEAAALMDAARRVQQIGEETLADPGDGTPDPVVVPSETGTRPPAGNAPTHRPAVAKKRRKSEYPQFLRDGDSLVKIGWSKSEGAEYEHKCPKRVLDVLVGECARVAGPGKRFVMDKLLPLRDPAGGGDLPGYQAYVGLAFLRHAGLVQQHGRSGYSIPKPKTLVTDAAVAWNGSKSR